MSKILIVKGIERCNICLYIHDVQGNSYYHVCTHPRAPKIIHNSGDHYTDLIAKGAQQLDMPAWCPLPDEQNVSRETIEKPETD